MSRSRTRESQVVRGIQKGSGRTFHPRVIGRPITLLPLVRLAYYGKDFPAATWVKIQRLGMPAMIIKVELIAAFPEESTKTK